MYNVPHFKEPDRRVIIAFIHQHPFAFLTGCDENSKPVATQIPVFIEERDDMLFLSGHIMRGTDHHKAFEKNTNVLCVFTGDHTYVSATWYNDPHQASTWNYMSVHVSGSLKFLDEAGLIAILKKTTLHFEKSDKTSPTVFENLSEEYTSRLMKGIIAFEVKVEELKHAFKLSQNKDSESFNNIIEKLNDGDPGSRMIACEMKKREEEIFKKQ